MQFLRIVEEKLVANSSIGLSCNGKAKADTEKVGVFTFDGKAKRVGAEIVEPPLEFAISRKNVVVVATRPEVAVGAVILGMGVLLQRGCSMADRRQRGGRWLTLLQPCCSPIGKQAKHQLPIGFVTASLKTFDYLSQMLSHTFPHKEDAMQMIWHDLESHHFYFRVYLLCRIPAFPYLFTQLRQLHMRPFYRTLWSIAPPHQSAQQRPSSLHSHRDEVHPS